MLNLLTHVERRVLYICIAVMAVTSYFLFDDSLIIGLTMSKGPQIGQIELIENDVRYRFSQNLQWTSVKKGNIYLGDSLFTGERSKAKVRLKDDSLIEMRENSLVTFNFTNEEMTLGLKFGSFGGKIAKNIKVEGIKGVITGTGKVEIAKTMDNNIIVNATEGDLKVKTDSGDQKLSGLQVIDESNKVRLPTKEEIESAPRTVIHVEETQVVSENKVVLASETPLSESPTIISPEPYAKKTIFTKKDGTPTEKAEFDIQWTYSKKSVPFEIQISSTLDFDKLEATLNSSKPKIRSPNLAEGTHYIRVRDSATTDLAWSAPIQVDILFEKKVSAVIPSPKLARTIISSEADKNEKIVVKWSSVKEAKEYLFESSKDPQFLNSEKFKTSEINYTVQNTQVGTTYFRVYAISPDEDMSLPSSGQINTFMQSVKTNKTPSKIYTAKSDTDVLPRTNFNLSWQKKVNAHGYKIQISESKDFNQTEEFNVSDNNFSYPLNKEKELFWRVQPTDQHNEPIAEFSKIENFSYQFEGWLKPPLLVEPKNDISMFFQSAENNKFWLFWQPVENATSYRVEISSSKDFSKIIYSKVSKSNKALVDISLDSGTYYWRVRSEEENRKSNWSSASQMNLFSGRTAGGY